MKRRTVHVHPALTWTGDPPIESSSFTVRNAEAASSSKVHFSPCLSQWHTHTHCMTFPELYRCVLCVVRLGVVWYHVNALFHSVVINISILVHIKLDNNKVHPCLCGYLCWLTRCRWCVAPGLPVCSCRGWGNSLRQRSDRGMSVPKAPLHRCQLARSESQTTI